MNYKIIDFKDAFYNCLLPEINDFIYTFKNFTGIEIFNAFSNFFEIKSLHCDNIHTINLSIRFYSFVEICNKLGLSFEELRTKAQKYTDECNLWAYFDNFDTEFAKKIAKTFFLHTQSEKETFDKNLYCISNNNYFSIVINKSDELCQLNVFIAEY